MPRVLVVMGVAGAGKTTVGQALATALDWEFHDADDWHPIGNRDRLARGVALTDADRAPWLASLRALIADVLRHDRRAVLACSALTAAYREALVPRDAPEGAIVFVHLAVPGAVLAARLAQRTHFAAPSILESQLATLEEPRAAIIVDGTREVGEIVAEVKMRVAD